MDLRTATRIWETPHYRQSTSERSEIISTLHPLLLGVFVLSRNSSQIIAARVSAWSNDHEALLLGAWANLFTGHCALLSACEFSGGKFIAVFLSFPLDRCSLVCDVSASMREEVLMLDLSLKVNFLQREHQPRTAASAATF